MAYAARPSAEAKRARAPAIASCAGCGVVLAIAARSHELAVRRALGAGAGQIVRAGCGRMVGAVGLGGALGLLAVLGAAPWLDPVLYATSSRSIGMCVGTVLVLLAVTALASGAPVRRTLRIHPAAALRAE